MITIPRIVIAGTHSGCGKTTIASGIMAALTARGIKVQPFKVGPDFIDPSHHTRICKRPSRNLDPFMMGEDGCLETFARATTGADIAVIEGVMGMYDGIDGTDTCSTAHVARILKSPVILVCDVKGMSRSVHAIIQGFRTFDPSIHVAGVIFNKIGSPRHRKMIESAGTIRSFGWIPRSEGIGLASRHLGLVMANESDSLDASGRIIEEHGDPEGIIAAAKSAPPLAFPSGPLSVKPPLVSIGVALDDAFCFYYQDNLDHLRDAGAELVFFSPLVDHLPEVDAIYLGGGYPELHLPALESSPCTRELKIAVERGLPVLAECGGLMYLGREIRAEKTYRMAGLLPADTEMTKKIQGLGYVKGSIVADSSILPKGTIVTGHEFHYSRILADTDVRFALRLERGRGIDAGNDGIMAGTALGMYTHAYFSQSLATDIVQAAGQWNKS
ncbi:MAG: cobyrinic acid a,c-diamide synthase [Methanomicrobiales archaeon HGW-Methanomicrobiales-3]|jgi:cobyrinic acid a,c-diamide synthase|nr:MAG: cobyrinic acid a,c-diamide synthase [Methanomicrobiales archaeon HGW-Methanomicrobiales-3]